MLMIAEQFAYANWLADKSATPLQAERIRQRAQKKRPLKKAVLILWELTDSNRRPSACKADALNQLS